MIFEMLKPFMKKHKKITLLNRGAFQMLVQTLFQLMTAGFQPSNVKKEALVFKYTVAAAQLIFLGIN